MSLPVAVAHVSRVLVYRRGALGDTVVALPVLHLLRRRFPQAEIGLLTVQARGAVEVSARSVLDGSGLIDAYFGYPVGERRPGALWSLIRKVRAWRPELAVYLAEAGGAVRTLRDDLFLRGVGVAHLVGVPWRADQRGYRVSADGLREREAERLARCVAELGDARVADPASWDLRLSEAERAAAGTALGDGPATRPRLVLGIGTKAPEKDWGDANWRAVLDTLGGRYADHALIAVGAAAEGGRADGLLRHWPGPTRNLCGVLTPRESAAAIAGARLFIGHDSGPMHLAAAVGVPTVCVFGRGAPPGVWFPVGAGHRPIYPAGEEGDLAAIPPARVVDAACAALG